MEGDDDDDDDDEDDEEDEDDCWLKCLEDARKLMMSREGEMTTDGQT